MAVKQVAPFLPFLHAAVVTEFATAAFLWDIIRPILAKSQHHLFFTIPILFPPTSSHCQEPKPYIHFPHPVLSRSPSKDSHDSEIEEKQEKIKEKTKKAFFRPFSGEERKVRGFLHSIQVNKNHFLYENFS